MLSCVIFANVNNLFNKRIGLGPLNTPASNNLVTSLIKQLNKLQIIL